MRAVDDVVCSKYEPGCDATVADEGFTVSQPEFHQRTLMRANGGPLPSPSLSCDSDVRSLHSESAVPVQAWPVSLPPTVPHPHSGWLLPDGTISAEGSAVVHSGARQWWDWDLR